MQYFHMLLYANSTSFGVKGWYLPVMFSEKVDGKFVVCIAESKKIKIETKDNNFTPGMVQIILDNDNNLISSSCYQIHLKNCLSSPWF